MANDDAEMGTFGVLHLMKRQDPKEKAAVFPIDEPELTFGRDSTCSVRLYYAAVSSLHAKLVFAQNKNPLLFVLGTNGVVVDGNLYMPNPKKQGIPLSDKSYFEVHKRRFVYHAVPPQPRMPFLGAFSPTPSKIGRRRSLRMSLVEAAEIFSPRRGPATPQNFNLAMLQAPFSPSKLKQEIQLIQGDGRGARVVESERDLVVLEEVDEDDEDEDEDHPVQQVSQPSLTAQTFATPPRQIITIPSQRSHAPVAPSDQQSVQTPRQRPVSSLHKAVLLRSAQRTMNAARTPSSEKTQEDAMEVDASTRADMSMEDSLDQEEEDEVEDVVSPERQHPSLTYEDVNDEETNDEADSRHSHDMEDVRPVLEGLDRMTMVQEEKISAGMAESTSTQVTPAARRHSTARMSLTASVVEKINQFESGRNMRPPAPSNTFWTPQCPKQMFVAHAKPSRASIGGTSLATAQRVRVVKPWKIEDITIPLPDKTVEPNTPKPKVSPQERQAILERRRSALQTPSTLPIPGLNRTPGFPARPRTPEEEFDDVDTATMLQRMKERVDGLRRKSEITRESMGVPTPSPRKQGFSLFAPGVGVPMLPSMVLEETDSQMQQANDMRSEELNVGDMSMKSEEDELEMISEVSMGQVQREELSEQRRPPSVAGLTDKVTGPPTPSFAGLKHMFNAPKPTKELSLSGLRDMYHLPVESNGFSTPGLKSIRDLMHQHPTLQTPQYGGLEELMKTPDGWTAPSEEHATPTTGDQSPSHKSTKSNNTLSSTLSRMSLDEQDDEEPKVGRAKSKPNTTTRRAGGRSTETPDGDNDTVTSTTVSKGTGGRHVPSRSVKTDRFVGAPEVAIVHKTRRTRKALREDADEEIVPGVETGRTQSAAANETSDSSSESEAEAPPKRNSRKKNTPQPALSDVEEDAPKTRNGKSVTSTKGTKAKATPSSSNTVTRSTRSRSRSREPEERADLEIPTEPVPLLPASATRSGRKKVQAVTPVSADDSAPTKGRRIPAARSRKATGDKENVSEAADDVEEKPDNKPVGRGTARKTAVKSAQPKTPATDPPVTRARRGKTRT